MNHYDVDPIRIYISSKESKIAEIGQLLKNIVLIQLKLVVHGI